LAAVVPSDSEEEAAEAAAAFTAAAARAGVVWPAMHFAVSRTGVKPPWVVRAGASMSVDIAAAMARGSAARPPLGPVAMEKALAAVMPSVSVAASSEPAKPLSPGLLRLA